MALVVDPTEDETASRINDPSDDRDRAVLGLRRLIMASERFRLAAATFLGVSVLDSQALSYLTESGSIGQQDLADSLQLTTGSVTTLVDRLEARGLAERRPHGSDRRRITVHLTEAGTNAVHHLRSLIAQSLDDLAKDEMPAAAELFEKVSSNLDQVTAEMPTESHDGAAPRRRR